MELARARGGAEVVGGTDEVQLELPGPGGVTLAAVLRRAATASCARAFKAALGQGVDGSGNGTTTPPVMAFGGFETAHRGLTLWGYGQRLKGAVTVAEEAAKDAAGYDAPSAAAGDPGTMPPAGSSAASEAARAVGLHPALRFITLALGTPHDGAANRRDLEGLCRAECLRKAAASGGGGGGGVLFGSHTCAQLADALWALGLPMDDALKGAPNAGSGAAPTARGGMIVSQSSSLGGSSLSEALWAVRLLKALSRVDVAALRDAASNGSILKREHARSDGPAHDEATGVPVRDAAHVRFTVATSGLEDHARQQQFRLGVAEVAALPERLTCALLHLAGLEVSQSDDSGVYGGGGGGVGDGGGGSGGGGMSLRVTRAGGGAKSNHGDGNPPSSRGWPSAAEGAQCLASLAFTEAVAEGQIDGYALTSSSFGEDEGGPALVVSLG